MSASTQPKPSDPDALVIEFRYLCVRAARKFVRTGLERADLEQVAALGLVKAARRYRPSAATPFAPYAWKFVIGELMHFVRDHEFGVRIPRDVRSLERNVTLARDAFVVRFFREPSDAELAASLAVPPGSLGSIARARGAARTLSLDEVRYGQHGVIESLDIEDRFVMAHAFANLGELERAIVRGVYFLGLTQRQLSVRLRLTPKNVSRIHLGALASLRRALAA